MKASTSIFYGLITAIVILFLLVYFFPSLDDFNLKNPSWNGITNFSRISKAQPIKKIADITYSVPLLSETILYLIGPSKPFTPEELSSLTGYLKGGGTLILADDFGSGNAILQELGLNTRFSGHLLIDPLFRNKASTLPKIVNLSPELKNITALVFNYATTLNIDPLEIDILASSSSYSYTDSNLNQKWDKEETKGPFPVIGKIEYGEGKLYLISDSSIFINSMLNKEDNKKLIALLTKNKKSFIDTFHWQEARLSKLKSAQLSLYQLFSPIEARYSLLFLFIALIVWLRVRQKKARASEELQETLAEHPHWDKEILKILEKGREK